MWNNNMQYNQLSLRTSMLRQQKSEPQVKKKKHLTCRPNAIHQEHGQLILEFAEEGIAPNTVKKDSIN